MAEAPVLITIPISHYCEKARWALDRAGIAYRERAHLQASARARPDRAPPASSTATSTSLPLAPSTRRRRCAPLPQPDELPPAMAAQVRELRVHPAGAHALRMFREERH